MVIHVHSGAIFMVFRKLVHIENFQKSVSDATYINIARVRLLWKKYRRFTQLTMYFCKSIDSFFRFLKE